MPSHVRTFHLTSTGPRTWRWSPCSWKLYKSPGIGLLILCYLLSWPSSQPTWAQDPTLSKPTDLQELAKLEFFEKKVRPLLSSHCWECHGPEEQEAGLRLDNRNLILTGGDTGPAVVPGKPEKSILISAVNYGELVQMPPEERLSEEQVKILTRWVVEGALWPAGEVVKPGVKKNVFDFDDRAKHWAYQPLAAVTVPTVQGENWPRSDVDRFILARLEENSLTPSADSDKRTWLRRVTYDLVGLPPSTEEIAGFLADETPNAKSNVVDRLLASPRYGERWARHWLDLVRYAETKGHEFDYDIANAHQYRDYVIRAMNRDVPYNQFVMEHVAGDLLEKPRLNSQDGWNESILGTGFWFLGEEVHSPVDTMADMSDRTDNKIDVFSKAFLGMTVSCARCHDHKFDPIFTKDYYALAGFVLSSSFRQARFESMEHNRQVAQKLWHLRQEHRPLVLKAVSEALRPSVSRTSKYLLATLSTKSDLTNAGLDSATLERWREATAEAQADIQHPLHAWAALVSQLDSSETAADKKLTDKTTNIITNRKSPAEHITTEHIQSVLQPLCDKAAEQSGILKQVLPLAARVLVDFSALPPTQWRQDGFSFGPGPTRLGDVRFSGDAQHPLAKIYSLPGASSDPTWNVLRLAAGTARTQGRLNWVQSGRTIRTPTFELSSGRVFYLVSGSGHAYAGVDQHRMINGPLHGALIGQWRGDDSLRWIEQDLSDYKGHRVHFEFTPFKTSELKEGQSADLNIHLIVEAEQAPPIPACDLGLQTAAAIAGEVSSLQQVADAYQSIFLSVLEAMATGNLEEESVYRGKLANWLVTEGQDLFPISLEQEAKMVEVCRPLLDKQNVVIQQIQKESHTAPALLDGSGVDDFVHIRGSNKNHGDIAPRRFMQIFERETPSSACTGSGRLELAKEMTNPDVTPLFPRVIVNRIWKHHFGRGIVASTDDFGHMGSLPTHPELLDYLAHQFIQQGWSLKKLHRTLVLSRTYQMASHPGATAMEKDPGNLLWHYIPVRRLEAEEIRDTLLAISGSLNVEPFAASVPTYLTAFMSGRGRPKESGPLDGDGRRSIYLSIRRNFLSPFFLAFDFPQPFSTRGRRGVSNVPAQALAMMNNPFVHQQAQLWGERLSQEPVESPEQRVSDMYEAALGRVPSENELHVAVAFITERAEQYQGLNDPHVWTDFGHVLFMLKEFIYIP